MIKACLILRLVSQPPLTDPTIWWKNYWFKGRKMDVKVQRAWSLNNELKIGGEDLSTWLVFFIFGSPFIFCDNWYHFCYFWTNKTPQVVNITRKYNHMFRSIKTQKVWNRSLFIILHKDEMKIAFTIFLNLCQNQVNAENQSNKQPI